MDTASAPILDHMAALADPIRRDMVARLCAGDATVGELAAPYDVSIQAVSKHLTTLGGAGLVTRARAGREARYRIRPEPLLAAAAWMAETGARWDARLTELQRYLSIGSSDA